MKPQEAGVVLAVASAFDARLTPRSQEDSDAKTYAWSLALDEDMPVDWAQKFIAKHYAESSVTVMPADVNRAWRYERRARKEAEREQRLMLEIESATANAVPMPEELRKRIAALANKKSVDNV